MDWLTDLVKFSCILVTIFTIFTNGWALHVINRQRNTKPYAIIIPTSIIVLWKYLEMQSHNPASIIILGLGIIILQLFITIHAYEVAKECRSQNRQHRHE